MEKIRNIIQGDLKQYFRQYLLTNLFILALTIVLLIDLKAGTLIEILFINIVQLFAVESVTKTTKNRIILSTVATSIAVLLMIIMKYIDLSLKTQLSILGYTTIVGLAGLYAIVEKCKLGFNEYLLRTSENLIKAFIVYLILEVGINALVIIFSELILNSSPSIKILLNIQIMLIGFYLIPVWIFSISRVNQKASKVFKNIIIYVVTPLIIIAYIIVYIYVLKILITREMPKDTIFMMMSFIFSISYFVWTISYKMDNKITMKLSKIMPVLFIPLFILQIYSIIIRIIPYGFTEKRYMCVMLLIFELAAIILSLSKQRKKEINIIFVTIIIVLISTIMPKINMEDVTTWSNLNWQRKEDKSNYTNFNRINSLDRNI